MSEDILNNRVNDVVGITPTYGEVLAMNNLIRRGVEDARENGEDDLAELGGEFLAYFDPIEMKLAHAIEFNRRYVSDE